MHMKHKAQAIPNYDNPERRAIRDAMRNAERAGDAVELKNQAHLLMWHGKGPQDFCGVSDLHMSPGQLCALHEQLPYGCNLRSMIVEYLDSLKW